MKYKLTVIKYEEDKDYEKRLAEWKENNDRNSRYHNERNEPMPINETATRSLEVFLTDEEYEKVKQEIIKIFK
jgi:hypothetical protein